jgi:mRNA interferase RelE/StbE
VSYTVKLTDKAKKQLSKMDKYTAKLISSWIFKNLVGCENPRAHGKGLTSNRSGQWRYRVGDYRILAEISEGELLILLVDIAHRSVVYDN